jgi:predicted DNA binding CopG/RHH family protein
MKMNERIAKRLRQDRPMTTISIRVPEDVIDDLKLLAPVLGFSGYQPLIRAYIGQGLRKDVARLESHQLKAVAEALRRHGVEEQVIAEALADARFLPFPQRGAAVSNDLVDKLREDDPE